jgi:hypothetical protein
VRFHFNLRRYSQKKIKGPSAGGCYEVDGKRSCAYSMIEAGSLPDNCEQLMANAQALISEYNDRCCGFWKRISRLIQVVIVEVLVMVLLLLLLVPKIYLKIYEIALLVIMSVLKLAEAAIVAAIRAIGSFGNMGRVLNKRNRVIKPKFMQWIDKLVLMRIWEVTLAAEFSPTSLGFACSIDMVLFSQEINFSLSFSLDFSYIMESFVKWVQSWIAGESGGDDAAAKKASSALGAPAAPGFSAHPSFAFDTEGTQHGRVYADAYVAAKRSVAPRARSLALVRARAVLGLDDGDHAQGGDLREHIGHEHERHASLVALVAAARAHSSESALGAALRAAPVDVSSHIAAILGAGPTAHDHDEWVAACEPKSSSDAHDVCGGAAAAAAVACASSPGSTDCAYALSALRSHHCAGRSDTHPHIASCSSLERLRAAFPACTHGCVAAMHGVGSACGFLVPRAGHGHSGEDSSACDGAVRAAQSQCASSPSPSPSAASSSSSSSSSSSLENAACVDALSAVPGALIAKASEHSAAFMGGKHVLTWSEAGARGVLHDGMCALASDGHLDLRGNELLGAVPACMLAAGSDSSGNLFLARNRLSGGIGKVGAHVATLIANDNKLTGHLGDALEHAAPGIKTLKVSGNKFHGSYSFIHRLASVEHLDIEDNSLGEEGEERHSGDPLPRMIASLGALKYYAVAGNAFGTGALRTTPAAKTEVHVTLVLRVPAHKFCSACSAAAHGLHMHECAAHATCRGERDQNIAARLECVVAAHAPHGAVAKIERVVPHVTADGTFLSVAALTVTLPAAPSEEGDAPVDADEVARAIEEHIGEGAGPIWNRAAAAAASCDQEDAHGMAYRGAEVERVVARAACGAGLSGDECLHFCPTTWARVDERVRADTIAMAQPKPVPEPDHFLSALGAPKDAPYGAPIDMSPAKLGTSDVPRRTFHESLHYVYKGAAGERLPFSTSLDQCTSSCRAHAAMAIAYCNDWLAEAGGVFSD